MLLHFIRSSWCKFNYEILAQQTEVVLTWSVNISLKGSVDTPPTMTSFMDSLLCKCHQNTFLCYCLSIREWGRTEGCAELGLLDSIIRAFGKESVGVCVNTFFPDANNSRAIMGRRQVSVCILTAGFYIESSQMDKSSHVCIHTCKSTCMENIHIHRHCMTAQMK